MRSYTLFLFFVLCLLYRDSSSAQRSDISGKIIGSGVGLPAATVSLLNSSDSSWIRTVITGDQGEFSFKGINPGKYTVSATSIGYETGTQLLTVNDSDEPKCTLVLQKLSTSLQEVTVAGKKPFIEMSLGKTVVNIEGTTTTAASTVLDLMRRLPGVSVDQNGNITMQGKQGVLVLIDDRPTYLSGNDLAEYLKTITADEAAQIELITQPGARYDASGNNGVINIKLRKNKKQGWNGNITLTYGNGVYFHRNESFLLNYKKNKLSLSLSGNDMEAIGFADWKENRNFIDQQTGNTTATSIIHSAGKERFSTTALRMTADYDLTEKTRVGINIRGAYHPNTNHDHIFSANTDETNKTVTYNDIPTADGFIRRDITANANLTHKFTKENNLDINFDYLTFHKNAYQDLSNTTYDSQMHPLPDPLITHSSQPETISVCSIKADETYTFKNGMKLEAGVKSSWEATNFNADVSLYENNTWINDTGFSNHFLYRENINAGYLTLAKSIAKKWEARAGLRAENTNTEGVQYVGNTRFSKNYTSLFPTAYLTYKKDTNNQFEVNYGRRIDRPGYQQLNPFVYYSFENYYSVGNPYLLPQYTNSIELKHSYKNRLITTLSFSRATGLISDLFEVNDTTKNIYDVTKNLASNDYVVLSVLFNKELFKWWTFNASGSGFYAGYTGLVNNKNITAELSGYSFSVNTQFDFGKGWKSEIYAYYNSAGRWSVTTTFDANSYMEFGASKKINERILVKVFAADPFYLSRLGIHDYMDNFRSDSKFRYASQLFSLSFTYNFGGKQTGLQKDKSIDEAQRIK